MLDRVSLLWPCPRPLGFVLFSIFALAVVRLCATGRENPTKTCIGMSTAIWNKVFPLCLRPQTIVGAA